VRAKDLALVGRGARMPGGFVVPGPWRYHKLLVENCHINRTRLARVSFENHCVLEQVTDTSRDGPRRARIATFTARTRARTHTYAARRLL
jgi:hypothetical protein